MLYTLMHKNEKIALLDFTDNGHLKKTISVRDKSLLPYPAQKDIYFLKEWIDDRAIPNTRHGIASLLKSVKAPTTNSYLLNNLGLSLTDSYWLCPTNDNYIWENINLFDNPFSESIIGNIGNKNNLLKQTKFSADASLQGELKKKWIIGDDNKRYLIKGNYDNDCQQSLNEIVATMILERQGFKEFVRYTGLQFSFDDSKKAYCCISENYIKNNNIEFIPAWHIRTGFKIKGSESSYHQYINACIELGLDRKYLEDFIQYQILFDYIITNTDRHFNNFGIIRDTNTLRAISCAPIYDNGNSMFWNIPPKQINLSKEALRNINTHSFLQQEYKMLKYVANPNLISISNLPTKEEIRDIYESTQTMTDEKISKIISCYTLKIESLKQLQNRKNIYFATITPLEDLIKNTPEIKMGSNKGTYNKEQTFNNGEEPENCTHNLT